MKVNQIPEDAVYEIIVRAAIEKLRCPTNSEIAAQLPAIGPKKPVSGSSIPRVLNNLIRRGQITVQIYGHNWRVIVILNGPHAGSKTLVAPHGWEPYIVIDQAERERRDNRD